MVTRRFAFNAAQGLNIRIGISIASLVLLSWTAFGQVSESISGFVRDPAGAGIPDAHIIVTNSETGVNHTLGTDEHGYYRALSLPVGRYNLTVEKTGFRT